jgi:thioredoxin reductase
MFDVIVVGGSYAGMAAATQLARARRKVLVLDGGRRRNRFAEESHGFLTRDGADPAEIARIAREQLMAYPTVEWREAEVTAAEGQIDGFRLTGAGDTTAEGKRLLLAIGLSDELPDIPGLAERWGRHVFHCPYCHGYEVEGPIGVLNAEPRSFHHALMLPDWGPTTFFLNGAPMPQASDLAALEARGVVVDPDPIGEIAGKADIVMQSGRVVSLGGLFTSTRNRPSSPIASELGCAIEEGPSGPFVRTSDLMETAVPGVFACGDVTKPFGSVAIAVGDGAFAGGSVHRSLMFGTHK